MPSGRKKRKTAWKKKEKEAKAKMEGNEVVKSQDDKGSGDNNHNHDRPIQVEDDESENIAPSSLQPTVAERKFMEKDGVFEIMAGKNHKSESEDCGVLKVEMDSESDNESQISETKWEDNPDSSSPENGQVEETIAVAENSAIAHVITNGLKDSDKTRLPMPDEAIKDFEEKSLPVIRESEIPICFENQRLGLISAGPRGIQNTSFSSCCGLFDVFMSSSR